VPWKISVHPGATTGHNQDKAMEPNNPNCARCAIQIAERVCRREGGKHPVNCPTAENGDTAAAALAEYLRPEIYEFARQASLQEKEGYSNREKGYELVRPCKPRIEEIFEFIDRMGYRRIGMAFCLGLRKEAAIVERLFSSRGLEMVSAVCKIGRVPKETLALKEEEKIAIGTFETMCNPILQAKTLNAAETEFNILLGLCVGHDSLFFQYAEAPCTVLAVKDRVTGHNPLAAIYTLDSYYRALK
jgi:uncharacterized metal-binding protein